MGLGRVRVLACNRFFLDLQFFLHPLLVHSSISPMAFSFSDLVGIRFLLNLVFVCVFDGACRRDSKRQLQPVPGGDLSDGFG